MELVLYIPNREHALCFTLPRTLLTGKSYKESRYLKAGLISLSVMD
jgi:hypothetical protein